VSAFSSAAFATTAFALTAFAFDVAPTGAAVTPNTVTSLGQLFQNEAYGAPAPPVRVVGPTIADLKRRAAAQRKADDLTTAMLGLHLLAQLDEDE